MGALGSIVITAITGRLSFRVLRETCQATIKTTAMMMFILMCAQVFALAFVVGGVPGVVMEEEIERAGQQHEHREDDPDDQRGAHHADEAQRPGERLPTGEHEGLYRGEHDDERYHPRDHGSSEPRTGSA